MRVPTPGIIAPRPHRARHVVHAVTRALGGVVLGGEKFGASGSDGRVRLGSGLGSGAVLVTLLGMN